MKKTLLIIVIYIISIITFSLIPFVNIRHHESDIFHKQSIFTSMEQCFTFKVSRTSKLFPFFILSILFFLVPEFKFKKIIDLFILAFNTFILIKLKQSPSRIFPGEVVNYLPVAYFILPYIYISFCIAFISTVVAVFMKRREKGDHQKP